MNKKIKILLAFLVVALAGFMFMYSDKIAEYFQANIFSTTGTNTTTDKEVFIPDNYLAVQGETGQIEIKANQDFDNVVGFSFELEWNSEQLSVIDIDNTDTPFYDQGFLFDSNKSTSGVIKAIAATGREGVSILDGETFMKVSFNISSSVPLGSAMPIKINNFSIVQETDTLEEKALLSRDGKISVQNTGDFRITDISTLSPTSVQVDFSDYVSVANLSDFNFYPALKNTFTTIDIQGRSVVIENLGEQIPFETYRLIAGGGLTGNSSGNIAENYDYAFFTGYPDTNYLSDFYIESIVPVDTDIFEIEFSKAINPLSIEKDDFQIKGLDIINIEQTNTPTVLRVQTSMQDVLTDKNTCSAEVIISDNPDLYVKKSANRTVINPGDTITYNIKYGNNSANSGQNVYIENILPTAFEYFDTNDGCEYSAVDRKISCAIGTVTGETSGSVSYSATALSAGTIDDEIIIYSDKDDINENDNADTEKILISSDYKADLSIETSFEDLTNDFDIRVDFKNTGNVSAKNNLLNLRFNPATTLDIDDYTCNFEGNDCLCVIDYENGSAECQIDNLSAGGAGFLKLETKKYYQGQLTIYANILSNSTADANGLNNYSNTTKNIIIGNPVNFEIEKTASRNVLNESDTINVFLNYKNTSGSSAQNVKIYDEIHDNFSFEFNSFSSDQCTFNALTNKITCTIDELAPFEESVISYNMSADTGGESLSTPSIGINNNLFDGNTFQTKVGPSSYSDLSLESNAELRDGVVYMTIDYKNAGNKTAENMQIKSKMNFAGIAEIQNKTGCVVNSDRSEISCNINSLDPGANGSIEYVANVVSTGRIDFYSTISGTNDFNNENNIFEEELIINNTSYVEVESLVSPSVLNVGENTNIEINYKNTSDLIARNVFITNEFDSSELFNNIQITNNNGQSCTTSTSGIRCFIGDLLPQESGTIIFEAKATDIGTVNSDTKSSNGGSDKNIITISANSFANLTINKSSDQSVIKPNETVNYTITYANTGNASADNVVLTDFLPDELENIQLDSNTADCSIVNSQINCNLGTLNPDDIGTITYSADIAGESNVGDIISVAEISTSTSEPDLSDNAISLITSIRDVQCYIDISPKYLANGETAMLSWDTNSYYANIGDIGEVETPSGSIEINPSENTNYIMSTSPAGNNKLIIESTTEGGLKSTDGENLSINIFAFNPYGASSVINLSPKVLKAESSEDGNITIYFENSILASSAISGTCQTTSGSVEGVCDIYSVKKIDSSGQTNGDELVTEDTVIEIADNYKEITLKNVETKAGNMYLLQIQKGTIKDYNSNETIENFYAQAVFLGKKSTFQSSDFGISEIINNDTNSITINFNAEPADSSANPLLFTILSFDGFDQEKLIITNATKDGNSITLDTYAQENDKLYYLIIDPEEFEAKDGANIGNKNNKGFFGYDSKDPVATSVSPGSVNNDVNSEIIISGQNFRDNSSVKIGSTTIETSSITSSEIIAVVPIDFTSGLYDLSVVAPNGTKTELENAIIVNEAEKELTILSDESYASPYRVSNLYGTTRLWVRIEDPLGVDDIEKVTADLRFINGSTVATFTGGTEDDENVDNDTPSALSMITDNKRWFYLDVTIPPEASTSEEPVTIDITAENKSGITAYGTVELMITRDTTSGIAPVIENAYAYPATISPTEDKTVSFYIEVSDADGADNVNKVILDLGVIGLGTKIVRPIDDMYTSLDSMRTCTVSDYVVGEWSDCGSNGIKTRSVTLKSGVECEEDADISPPSEQACDLRTCVTSDWEPGTWSSCVDGVQTRSYVLKSGVNCQGTSSKPNDDSRTCNSTSSFIWDMIMPTAYADSSLSGDTIWFEATDFELPDGLSLGTYEIPITVVDEEGEKTKGSITLNVQQNSSDIPNIHKDDVYAVPRASVANDGTSTVTLYAKATDPNGADDLKNMTVNLMEIGLGPMEMTKTTTEGNGAWFKSDKISVDRSINPGHRKLSFTVTDKSGNFYTYDDFSFYVSDQSVEGDPPLIDNDRNYTSPRTGINDGKTKMSFYVFVEEGDASIDTVIANLGNIASYQGDPIDESSVSTSSNPTAENSNEAGVIPSSATPTSNNTADNTDDDNDEETTNIGTKIVPLTPSVKEGSKGQWFILSDVVIEERANPSTEPYLIEIIATDTNGNSAEGEIKLIVSDGILPEDEIDMPYLKSAIATNNRTVEALFSQAIDTKRIKSSAFQVVEYENKKTVLPIRDIDYSADGRIVKLTTNFMAQDTVYTLIADSDELGLAQTQKISNQVNFDSFTEEDYKTTPRLIKAESMSTNEVKLTFNQAIKYSSLNEDGSNFSIFEKSGGKVLNIRSARFGADNTNIRISTDNQVPNTDYYITQENLKNAIGQEVKTRSQVFQGYKYLGEGADSLLVRADFNEDGTIDFLDFTLFSTVYGKNVENATEETMDLNGDGKIDFTDFTIFAQNFSQANQNTETRNTSEFTPYEIEDNGIVPVFTNQ